MTFLLNDDFTKKMHQRGCGRFVLKLAAQNKNKFGSILIGKQNYKRSVSVEAEFLLNSTKNRKKSVDSCVFDFSKR